jgi:hypothetical protein
MRSSISVTRANDPVRVSEKVPAPDGGRAIGTRSTHQVGPIDGVLHQLTFLWHYGGDEKTIKVTAIGYMRVRLET